MCEVHVRLMFKSPRQHGIVRTLDRDGRLEIRVLQGRVTRTHSRVDVELRGPKRAVSDTLRLCRKNGLQIEPLSLDRRRKA